MTAPHRLPAGCAGPSSKGLRSCFIGTAIATLLCACGGGTAALVAGAGGGGGGSPKSPTVLSDLVVGGTFTSTKTSPIPFEFRATDADADKTDVEVVCSAPGGGPAVPAHLVGNPRLTQLATSPTGVVHTFSWDFASQFGAGFTPGVRLVVRTTDGSGSHTAIVVGIGNDAPVITNVVLPAAPTTGIAHISFDLADSSSDLVDVSVDYDRLDDASGWIPVSYSGQAPANLATDPQGGTVHFFWDVPFDEPGAEFPAILRLTATDGVDTAPAVITAALALDNNAAPSVDLDGAAFFATPDNRRGIPLPFRAYDPEGDAVRIAFQWRTPQESFPALPAGPSQLAALLADPVQRRLHQIATERPIAWRGTATAPSPTTLRLCELGSTEAGALAGPVIGRSVELLRADARPGPVAATWSSNPLVSPVAALPLDDGDSALVLDSPSAGSWRLREIELASGVVLRSVAASNGGDPCGLSAVGDGTESVLVADVLGGTWQVLRVELATGLVTSLKSADGSTVLGAVRGLESASPDTALITVGSSLIEVDASQAPATESILVGGLQGPRGIALDRRGAPRLFLAEQDWINPSNSVMEGRVLELDLRTLAQTTVVATAAPLRRPSAVALERDETRLIALCDTNTGDSVKELRAVDLGTASASSAFEIVNNLPVSASSVATGRDGLRVVGCAAANDLAVGSGVQQVRAITGWDVSTHVATLGAPLLPVPANQVPWRIVDSIDVAQASPQGNDDVFVWDSSDLVEGGQAILRAVPYDASQGITSDTSVPRSVLTGFDVSGIAIGGPATTADVTGIEAGDLNGDGLSDVVTTNIASDNVTVFFQSAAGTFPAAPSVTLSGIPILAPMTDPIAVTIIDVDSDGDSDLVSANRGSNNLSIMRMTAPGTYTTASINIGATAPEDVKAADLNGDGRVDLVTANGGSDRLTLFFQLPAGLFPLTASATLGNATTDKPTGVAVGDIDNDGDLDIVSCNELSDNVTVFLQTAAGVFAAAPSLTLGGSGITEGPTSVALSDLDADGKLDIACANGGGNSLSVFLQSAAGSFAILPTFTLGSSSGPVTPRDLAFADMNDDGWSDLLSVNAAGNVTSFLFDGASAVFHSAPLVFGAGGELNDPRQLALRDFDGDGRLDVAATSFGSDEVALFYQRGGGAFASTPDLALGSSLDTPGVAGTLAADLDADGDLDIACANPSGDGVALFRQFSPAVFDTTPFATLGNGAELDGVAALAAADLDGDGDVDLATANKSAGTLAVFLQSAGGQFASAATQILGGGTLGQPAWIVAHDLDGDGDFDLLCANETGHTLTAFLQLTPGVFASTPSFTLGNAATTNAPVHVVAADLEGDGDVDLVCASSGSNTLGVFRATAPGVFPATPSASLGGAASTGSPRCIVVGDFDGDGDLDLASANAATNNVTLFLQSTPGTFSASPSRTLTHGSVSTPTTLAASDVDGDGDLDLVAGSSGSHVLSIFEQANPTAFKSIPRTIGSLGTTDAPRALTAVDLDGDGDVDLLSAQPTLSTLAIFYGSH